jgi:outer membrane protein, heavy metal efflux system
MADRRFSLTALLCCWVGFALGGCAPGELNNVADVSAQVGRRSGYALGDDATSGAAWPPGVTPADGLSESEVVATVLWNNAAYRETLADLGLSRADLIQAGMLPNPTLWTLFPGSVKPFELLLRYPVEVVWLRPARVEAAELEVERTTERLVQNGLDVIREIRLAVAELALARERLELAGSTAGLAREVAELTRARLRAGDAAELDVTSAEADSRQAKEQQNRFRHEAEIASERLRALAGMGLEQWPAQIGVDPLPSSAPSDPERLVREAHAQRPDLRAAELAVEAAGKRAGLAPYEAFTFNGIYSAKEVGTSSNSTRTTVSGPGLDVAVPLLNQNQGGVAQAEARLEKAVRAHAALRDRIVLEVREAGARFAMAKESHQQFERSILPPLAEAARQAKRAYTNGNVTYLFVLEAQRKWADACFRAAGAQGCSVL